MNQEKIFINIDKTLFNEIAKTVGDSRKEAIEDFIAVVVQNYLENDNNNAADDNIVEKRLKDLGYL